MPAPRDTYVNPLLTNISVAYKNDSLIADLLFPVVTVDKETGVYFVSDRENLRAPADARRAEFGRANRVQNTLSQAAYALEEKTLETGISDRVMRQYSDPFNPKSNATNLVSDKLLLDKEKDLQTTLLAAASGSNTIDLDGAWTTITTDIVGQVRTGKNFIQKNTGKKANTILIGKPALDALLKNTALLDSIKYTQVVTEEALKNALANYFDIKRVLFGEAIENTAKEGQADSMDYVWSDTVVIAYVAPNPALEETSAGYHLQLANARYVDEWYEQEIKTTFVRANDFYDSKIVDAAALYIITDAA